MAKLSDLDVFPLCLGGNVFGWTADEDASLAVLDAYAAAGGNFIDTADTYTRPNMGVSETIIGRWMASRGNRDRMVIATKVGSDGGLKEKALAAQRAGVRRILAPSRNEPDLEDIPAPLREGMDFVWVDEIGDVFDAALRNGRRGYARRT